jgi:ABC-type glycerol-3-phosphate transport system permease component
MDCATTLQLFRLVHVPLMMPSLVAIGTHAILLAWNECRDLLHVQALHGGGLTAGAVKS